VGGIASKDDSGILKNKTWRQQEKKKTGSVGGIASKDDSGFLKNKTWRQQKKKKVEGIQRTQHPLNAGGNHRVHTNLPTETRKVKCTQGFPS